jgi:hypothetical protein
VPYRDAPQCAALEDGMPDTLNAAELRRLAMRCSAQAAKAECSAVERERLLMMREALLDLARNADWLAGRCAA